MPDSLPRNSATPPQIHPVFIWPNPERADLLFWVEKDGKLPKNKDWAFGDPYSEDPQTYPNHKLVYVDPQEAGAKWSKWYYVSDYVNQDAYNWEHVQADIGGTKFNSVRRSYITPRSQYDPITPAQGAAMPLIPLGKFQEGWVMAERKQIRTGDKELDSLYVAEERYYIQKVSLISQDIDDFTGELLTATRTWYYEGESGFTGAAMGAGLDANGVSTTVEQLTAAWWLVTERQTIGPELVAGMTYQTTEDFLWPAVLGTIDTELYERRSGGTDAFPLIKMLREAYRGPCKAVVTLKWNAGPTSVATPSQMCPVGVDYACPYYRLSVPDCLHPYIELKTDIGTTDPDYRPHGGFLSTFEETNYTDWPASILAVSEQSPFRGGFLQKTVTIFAPAS